MVWGESTYGDGDVSDMSMDSGEEAALPVWGISHYLPQFLGGVCSRLSN